MPLHHSWNGGGINIITEMKVNRIPGRASADRLEQSYFHSNITKQSTLSEYFLFLLSQKDTNAEYKTVAK